MYIDIQYFRNKVIMAEPLKYLYYQPEVFEDLAGRIQSLLPTFDTQGFTHKFYSEKYKEMELKAKMVYGAEVLHQYLTLEYQKAIAILEEVSVGVNGFVATTFPEFVAAFGLEHPHRSLKALKKFTVLCSSEFGIRPFIQKYPEMVLAEMLLWASDENEHVRRLASEGCRPRLPWGMALKSLQNDPTLILPILEKLHNDASEYVRRSVANNLNDISKDHPALVLDICRKWKGESKEVDRLIKHACRTLLKKGNTSAMVLFGFASPDQVLIKKFTTDKSKITIGEKLNFSFILTLEGNKEQKIRLEYKIHYVKLNGKTSPKVFQIKEVVFKPGDFIQNFSQAFGDLTTRKHCAGVHKVDLIVNGVKKSELEFELTKDKV